MKFISRFLSSRKKYFFIRLFIVGAIWLTLDHFFLNAWKNEWLSFIFQNHRYQSESFRIKDGFDHYAFNVVVSDSIGVNRVIPDTRHALCRNTSYYTEKLPAVSVIICFHNEAPSALVRSVASIVARTPSELLREIILINDMTNATMMRQITAALDHVSAGKTQLFSPTARLGLVRARIEGAKRASSDVLVFLDSHIEVNRRWLEPLLEVISADCHVVAVPIVDVIEADTFVYKASPLVRGGFNWALQFKWESIPREYFSSPDKYVLPIDTPAMSGGLFAVSRSYFFELGSYDKDMDVWGGENIEISLRVWMCGGKVQIIPCSRVGHVFRKRRPYGTPTGMLTSAQNAVRVAHVWLDDYKKYFFQANPSYARLTYGDVEERRQLRQRLNCSDFSWYLKHVYSSLKLPNTNAVHPGSLELPSLNVNSLAGRQLQRSGRGRRRFLAHFQLRLHDSRLCAELNPSDSPPTPIHNGRRFLGSSFWLQPCAGPEDHSRLWSQLLHESERHELLIGRRGCVQAERERPVLRMCHGRLGDQQWNYNSRRNTAFYSISAGLCLVAAQSDVGAQLVMDICDERAHVAWDLLTADNASFSQQ